MNIPLNRTTREMKKSNIALVSITLKALGSATKGELALQTGLSSATCGAVLNELSLSGEVLALDRVASRGGRPAQRYACNPDFFSLLSVYAAGGNDKAQLVWALTSATGELLEEGEIPFVPLAITTFYQLLDTLLQRYPTTAAIGIGVPGVVSAGRVVSCDISLFCSLPLAQDVATHSGRYTEVGNDINFTVWGFYRSSCAGSQHPIAYLYKPEGICAGCGLIINGEVLHGATHFAGEVAHLPLYEGQEGALASELSQIIVSLIALVNPATIALHGPQIDPALLAEVLQRCQASVPSQHLPALVLRSSIRQDYLQGIAELTLKNYQQHRLYSS